MRDTPALDHRVAAAQERAEPRGRRVLQGVVGIGLAVALLWWGLPYFAKTTWHDIGAVISSVPISHALGFQALMLAGLW